VIVSVIVLVILLVVVVVQLHLLVEVLGVFVLILWNERLI